MQRCRLRLRRCEKNCLRGITSTLFCSPSFLNPTVSHARRCISISEDDASPSSTHSSTRLATHVVEPDDQVNSLTRLRELLSEIDQQGKKVLFPDGLLCHPEEVWPPSSASSSSTLTTPSTTGSTATAAAAAAQSAVRNEKAHEKENRKQKENLKVEEHKHCRNLLRWCGGPPGVVRDVNYFTGDSAAQYNTLFHTRYYLLNKPTAPLLRCPACTARLLEADNVELRGSATVRKRDSRMPVLPRLWLDPPALDRHLSWAHADQLFTSQELATYNAQVLHELMYSCGLAPVSLAEKSEREQTGGNIVSIGQVDEWKSTPARLIIAADVANMEMGAKRNTLLEVLTSSDMQCVFSQVPIALCATHELFIPFTSKTLHILYQLALLHPASTLHVFVANTSLESGDLTMSAYLNEIMLASPSRTIPPVVVMTQDGQQRQVAAEMHGSGQRTLSPVGVVGSSSVSTINAFWDVLRTALTGSFWSV